MRFLLTKKIIQTKSPGFIIGLGIIFRVSQFLYNRSFTEGEAALAMNIVQRSYGELLKPLDYAQAAPVGFLYLQKLMVNLFGNNEYSLRILPLIAGIISLFLFYRLARRLLTGWALAVALILFATCDHLIYFSSEIKQYSTDVTIALLLYLIVFGIFEKGFVSGRIVSSGLAAAVSLWFSHSSLFIYGAIVIVLAIIIIRNRQWYSIFGLIFGCLIWLISLWYNYLISLEPLTQNKELLDFWSPNFMPFLIKSWADVHWFVYSFLRLFKNPLGLGIYQLLFSAFSFVIGCFVLLYKSKKSVAVLMLPIILSLFASGFKKYPFEGRLLLFIVPSMVIAIAAGIDTLRSKLVFFSNRLGIFLVITLLAYPVGLAFYHLIKPRGSEELRVVMRYLRNHYREGDVIYLYYAAKNAFQYYSDKFDFASVEYIAGTEPKNDWGDYYFDLVKLKGNKRVWIIFSHIVTWKGVDEERLFLSYLNLIGKKIDSFRVSGASAYLYDLSISLNAQPQSLSP
ncbi:MAG: glycosyltransferase family 39 protein [candidate division WOR-3 bacterium]|nr:glycosyltransferase family 39 protein [candidate division WOR-3 bacterium]